jgi:hypothetical protein
MVYCVQMTKQIVHAERRLARANDFVQESTSFTGDETWKRLAFYECRDSHLVQATFHLCHPCMEDIVLQALDFILDGGYELLKFMPSYSPHTVHRVEIHFLFEIFLGSANQRKEFLDVAVPECTWNDSIISRERLLRKISYDSNTYSLNNHHSPNIAFGLCP